MEQVIKDANRIRDISGSKQKKDKSKSDVITEQEFDAFCSGKTDVLLLNTETPLPESRGATAQPLFENTYQLQPSKQLHPGVIQKAIESTLEGYLRDKCYAQSEVKSWSLTLCDLIKEKIKGLSLSRYKIVCTVYLGEDCRQTTRIGSRCLWNKQFDSFASGVYCNQSLFALGVVYVLYFE